MTKTLNVFGIIQHRKEVDPIKAAENLNGGESISAITRWPVQPNRSDFMGDILSPATNVAGGWGDGCPARQAETLLSCRSSSLLTRSSDTEEQL